MNRGPVPPFAPLAAIASVLPLLVLSLLVGCGGNDDPENTSCAHKYSASEPVELASNAPAAELQATGCNTCSHSTLEASFRALATPTTGSITLSIIGTCEETGQFAFPFSLTQQAKDVSSPMRLDNLGIKDVCGDKKPITWEATLVNQTDITVSNAILEIDCYGKKGSSAGD